jgi:hypothetical protein
MTLDTIDRAFVARWQARRTKSDVTNPPEPLIENDDQEIIGVSCDEEVHDVAPQPTPSAETIAAAADEQTLIERLLAEGREQWERLADEVEVARRDGHRVIAVIGGEKGEGRTTLVECLANTLRTRGRDVVVFPSTEDASAIDGVHGHDRRIVLVDAGVWFPPGPIRRQRLVQESVGCDAAILVRRADHEPVAARATAIAALGMTVLGEVVTFASPDGDKA